MCYLLFCKQVSFISCSFLFLSLYEFSLVHKDVIFPIHYLHHDTNSSILPSCSTFLIGSFICILPLSRPVRCCQVSNEAQGKQLDSPHISWQKLSRLIWDDYYSLSCSPIKTHCSGFQQGLGADWVSTDSFPWMESTARTNGGADLLCRGRAVMWRQSLW